MSTIEGPHPVPLPTEIPALGQRRRFRRTSKDATGFASYPAWLKRACIEVEERRLHHPSTAAFDHLLEAGPYDSKGRKKPDYALFSNFPKHIVYQDDHLLLLNKPAGLISHYSQGFPFSVESIAQEVMGNNITLINRLDVNTTGLIVLAKTPEAFIDMKKQFAEKGKALKKVYLTFLDGEFADGAKQEVAVGIGNGVRDKMQTCPIEDKSTWDCTVKDSLTKFTPLILYHTSDDPPRPRTLTAVQILTGRTHQIRVVAAERLRKPVTGDHLYNEDPSGATRQMLHSYMLSFRHPYTGEQIIVQAPMPDDFDQLIDELNFIKAYEES